MKYIYWVSAVAVVAAGLYFALNVEVRPDTLSKIKYTQVQTPEDFGKEVFEALRLEVKASPVLFLGVTPNQIEDLEMWRGFLEANQEPGSKYDVIVVEPMLPYVELFDPAMRIDMKNEVERFAEGVKGALAQNLRVAVIVPSIYSSQVIKNNPYHRLGELHKIEGMSLTAAKFPVTKEQEQSFEPRCVVAGSQEADHAGSGLLGCAIVTAARKTYKEPIEDGKFSALMEQTGVRDYLILLNRNPNSK